MAWKNERGFTLVELVVVLAILGMIMAPLTTMLYQSVWIPSRNTDKLDLVHDLRQVTRWISEDGRRAQEFTSGSNPAYGTFSWVDYTSSPPVTCTVRYYFENSNLMRESTSNGSSSTLAVAYNINHYDDISFELSGNKLTVAITASMEATGGEPISKDTTVQVQMRPKPLVEVSAP